VIIRFRNQDDRIFEVHKNLGNCLQLYPLYIDERKNFYGIIFIPKESEENNKKLFSSNFFEILDSISKNMLFFKTKHVYQFYPYEGWEMKPFILKNGFIYFLISENEKSDFHGSCTNLDFLSDLDLRCDIFCDGITNDLNLLGALAMSAEYLDKKEKSALISAINFGYPLLDLVDFEKGEVTHQKDKIFRKWRDRLLFYFGDTERNFVKLLHRSTRKIIENNRELFERISSCIYGENGSFTARSFLKLMEIVPTKGKIYLERSMPRLLINKLIVESVLTAEREKRDDLKRNIVHLLENYPITGWLIDEWEDETLPPFVKGYRFAFLWDIPSEGISISEFLDHTEELREVILAALRKTERDAGSQLSRKRQEFWIRSIDVSLILPNIFVDTAMKTIKKSFAVFIDRNENSQLVNQKFVDDKLCVLSFRLRYPMFHDYQISKRKFGYFYKIRASDKLTRQGIESARKHLFGKSLDLLEMGSHAIMGDILVWKSKLAKGHKKTLYLREARVHYQCAGLPLRNKKDRSFIDRRNGLELLIDFSSDLASDLRYITKKITYSIGRLENPLYLPNMSPQRLLIAQQINYDWKIAVESYLIGKDMENDVVMNGLEYNEEDNEKRRLARMYLTYSDLSAKDSVCLVEDLGVFYAKLLGEVQEIFGDHTAEWLGFNF
jgi:hypothetical protein